MPSPSGTIQVVCIGRYSRPSEESVGVAVARAFAASVIVSMIWPDVPLSRIATYRPPSLVPTITVPSGVTIGQDYCPSHPLDPVATLHRVEPLLVLIAYRRPVPPRVDVWK